MKKVKEYIMFVQNKKEVSKMKNYVVRAVSGDKQFRVFLAITTNMVEEARNIHNTTPVATAALGRTITATAMMGLMMKGEDNKLSIQIKGNGPIKQILAVSDSKGNVKGYVANPYVDIPLRENGKLDVGGAVGNEGKIIVIKDLGIKEPYIGQSELVSGEIAEDITAYFASSEQQPSSVSLGVLVDIDRTVKASGGFILQVLPEIDEITLKNLENTLNNLPSMTQMIDKESDGEKLIKDIFKDFNIDILDKQEVRLICDCSEEKLEKALISIGKDDLKEIIEEDGQAELTCHFCNSKYHFDKEHLERLYKDAL